MIDRRQIVGACAATGFLGVRSLSAQTQSQPAPAHGLKATITLNGNTYSYPEGSKIPFYYVMFHPDGRIVFHLGALGDLDGHGSAVKPYHLGSHHISVVSDGRVIAEGNIPAHWWNAQWTYRFRQLAAVKTPKQIVDGRRMFPFGDTGAKIGPAHSYTYDHPMDTSGVTKYMPTTGERPDIGLITDPSAYYMLGGGAESMIAWALANGSFPLHYRDEATGRPVDLLKYPLANCYDDPSQGSPWFDRYPRDSQGNNIVGDGMVPQQAHFCEMSYVAYLATSDLGFLENVQYNANYTILCDAVRSTPLQAILNGEYRGIAWAFRNLFMAHVATLDAEAAGPLSSSCHPSSYFKKLLDNQLAYYSKAMANTNQQLWRLMAGDGMWGPWQVDYMLTALAFGVLTGHSDWLPLYLWALANVVARTNGISGFPPGYGTPYYMGVGPNGATSPRFKSWGEAFADIKNSTDPNIHYSGLTQDVYDSLKADPLHGGKPVTGFEYLMTTRAALVMAAYLEKLGLANVRTAYPELDTCIANVNRMFLTDGVVNPRVSVVSG